MPIVVYKNAQKQCHAVLVSDKFLPHMVRDNHVISIHDNDKKLTQREVTEEFQEYCEKQSGCDDLIEFEQKLERTGSARFCGTDYKILNPDDGIFTIETVKNGERETLVSGEMGFQFTTLERTRGYAISMATNLR